MVGAAKPLWPLASEPKAWTKGGSFGAPRPSSKSPERHHQGVDLYAPVGAKVYAMEDGIISGSQGWSGPKTKGLWVESPDTGIAILYGAVAPGSYKSKGTKVKRGEVIATIGEYPQGSSMAHIEIWDKTRIPRPRWNWNAARPAGNYDPAEYLARAMGVDVEPQADDDDAPELDDDQGGDVDIPKPKSGGGGGLLVAAAALVGGVILMR